jgi:polar amino acid transport system substrate-binding protein
MRIEMRVCLAAMALSSGAVAAAADLQQIKDRGRLLVAVYGDFAPFSDDGQGLDVDLGKALAEKLGVAAEIMTFREGEKVDDDLRNVIWKGHYLRKEQLADVMMHVPVDSRLAEKNEQVSIFGPYYSERLVVARNRNRIPNLVTLEVFTSEKIGVQAETVEDNYLLNAFGGALRQNVVHFSTTAQATAALQKNEIAAAMGRQTVIEAGLGEDAKRFGIAPVATPGLRLTGWDIGVAVKADRPELAAALDRAMADLLADGTVQRLFAKRGLTYSAPRVTASNAASGSAAH